MMLVAEGGWEQRLPSLVTSVGGAMSSGGFRLELWPEIPVPIKQLLAIDKAGQMERHTISKG